LQMVVGLRRKPDVRNKKEDWSFDVVILNLWIKLYKVSTKIFTNPELFWMKFTFLFFRNVKNQMFTSNKISSLLYLSCIIIQSLITFFDPLVEKFKKKVQSLESREPFWHMLKIVIYCNFLFLSINKKFKQNSWFKKDYFFKLLILKVTNMKIYQFHCLVDEAWVSFHKKCKKIIRGVKHPFFISVLASRTNHCLICCLGT
jgi:hypothetical protein